MRSFERVQILIDKINKRASIIGMNIFNADFTIFTFNFIFFCIIDMSFFMFVCAYCFVLYSGSLEKTIFCAVTVGFLVKAAVKIVTFVIKRPKINQLMKEVEKFHEIGPSHEFEEIFFRNARYLRYATIFIDILFSAVGILTILNPLPVKILTGELVLPYGFELPFIDPFSWVGYTLNYLYSAHNSFFCVIGFTCSEGVCATSIIPLFAVYEAMMKMMDKMEEFDDIEDEEEMEKRKKMLKEIIQIHQRLLVFIDDLENFYKTSNLLCLGTIVIQCVTSLFALIAIDWYIGAVIVMMNIFEIFMLCIFGALLEIIQEKFRDKIYEINWTNKSKSERKDILYMLQYTEKIVNFTCILEPLNFETFQMVIFYFLFGEFAF